MNTDTGKRRWNYSRYFLYLLPVVPKPAFHTMSKYLVSRITEIDKSVF